MVDRSELTKQARRYYEAKTADDQETVDDVFDTLGLDGWDCIGNGSGRNVYDMGILGDPDKCLKLAIPHPQYDGRQQNEREADLSATAPAHAQDYLLPVLDHGPEYHWLIMPYGDDVSEYPYQWAQDAKYDLDGLVWEEDIKGSNVVRWNGSYYLCDYGTPPQ